MVKMPFNKESVEGDLARVAGEIMFGDKYLDLIEEIYCNQQAILEFEAHPARYLKRHGIEIPDEIDVVIHDKGKIGKPGRVDFHWGEAVENSRARKRLDRQKMRELAMLAAELIHSEKLKSLTKAAYASPRAMKEFASDPKAYLKANALEIPDEIDVILHLEGGTAEPRVDLHFPSSGPTAMAMRPIGCYYCSGGVCCCYAA